MLTVRSPVLLSFLLSLSVLAGVHAAPKKGNNGGGGGKASLTPQQQAAQVPQGISTATDGSTILDTTATVKYAQPG